MKIEENEEGEEFKTLYQNEEHRRDTQMSNETVYNQFYRSRVSTENKGNEDECSFSF